MQKLVIVLFLLLPSYAMAQSAPKASDSAYPNTKLDERLKDTEEKKAPPVVVLPPDAVKPLNEIQTLRRVFELELENAKLKAANAELQLKGASDAFTKAFNEAYIKAGGTAGDGQYKWDVLPDGAWRVMKTVEEKPKTP